MESLPYRSSHLAGAQSELIVHSGHGVIGNPDAIREVIRILHLEQRPKQDGPVKHRIAGDLGKGSRVDRVLRQSAKSGFARISGNSFSTTPVPGCE